MIGFLLHRLWVLTRKALMRWFFWVPTICDFERDKKNTVFPCNPHFSLYRVKFSRVFLTWVCRRDGCFIRPYKIDPSPHWVYLIWHISATQPKHLKRIHEWKKKNFFFFFFKKIVNILYIKGKILFDKLNYS